MKYRANSLFYDGEREYRPGEVVVAHEEKISFWLERGFVIGVQLTAEEAAKKAAEDAEKKAAEDAEKKAAEDAEKKSAKKAAEKTKEKGGEK